MKKNYLLTIFILGFSFSTFAQQYGTALGLRLGNSDLYRTLGLSVQQRIAPKITLEGIIQTDFSRNSTVSILVEKHHSLLSKRFNFYYGGGMAFGSEESFQKRPETKEIIHTYGNQTLGIDLIGGIELALAGAVISFDYKPNINLTGREEFYRGQMGISARTILVKSKEQKKKQRQRQKAKNARKQSASKTTFSDRFKKD